ncbi:MAG: hypothetical protein IPP44_25040 [Ideonella sp.]|nr:hypothetical protein [Ideonella sp.]
MLELNLSRPLTTDQALIHIATGTCGFVRAMNGQSQLRRAREWLESGDPGLIPSPRSVDRERLRLLREAMRSHLSDLDGLEFSGVVWIWFAMQCAPDTIAPECKSNWQAYLAKMSLRDSPASIECSAALSKKWGVSGAIKLKALVRRPFEKDAAFGGLGRVTPKPVMKSTGQGWRCSGLEDLLRPALNRVAKAQPGLLARDGSNKEFRSDRLDRFDLYAVLHRFNPKLDLSSYAGSSILKALTGMVAFRRGRRRSNHPHTAPNDDRLEAYASEVLVDRDWLRYFGLRS